MSRLKEWNGRKWLGVLGEGQRASSHQLAAQCFSFVYRLHQMHEMQTIVTDVRSVCPSVCLSRSRLHCAGVIRCSLCQITLASC